MGTTNRIRVTFLSEHDDGPVQFRKDASYALDERYARGLPKERITLGPLLGDELIIGNQSPDAAARPVFATADGALVDPSGNPVPVSGVEWLVPNPRNVFEFGPQAAGVTVTQAASASAPAELAVTYLMRTAVESGVAKLRGGIVVGANNMPTKGASIASGSNVAVAGAFQSGPYIEIQTTAQTVQMTFYVGAATPTAKYRVAVDARYISRLTTDFAASSQYATLTIDLSAYKLSGETCTLRIEWDGAAIARTISVPAGGAVWAYDDGAPTLLVFGDSFSANGAGMSPHVMHAARMCRAMGWHYVMSGVGGTGFVATASGVNPNANDPLRIADLSEQIYDGILVAYGQNDVAFAAATVRDAAARFLTTLLALKGTEFPTYVAEQWNINAGAGVITQSACAAAIMSAVDSIAAPNIRKIKPATNQWITAANATAMIADGTHYSNAGTFYGASRLQAEIMSY